MFISHKRQVIYVRVPSTGSTTFINAIIDRGFERIPYSGDHWRLEQVPELLKEHSHYEVWGFVRHPYDWFLTTWLMRDCNLHEYGINNWDRETMKCPQAIESQVELAEKTRTPIDWLTIDGELRAKVFRTEDLTSVLASFDVSPMRLNSHRKQKAGIEIEKEAKAVIDRRFYREMEFYKWPQQEFGT